MTSPPLLKPRIVLFCPSPWRGDHYFGPPLSLLAIATLPNAAGYPVTIIVQDVATDPVQQVIAACDGALLFGVTSLTGTMIASGLEMCDVVRAHYPDLPIVWGGTHASIAPEQTCEHPLVDIVVAGQGEATFLELVEALDEKRPLETVAGLHFKRDGRVVKTGCRPTIDIDTLPPLPFELVDMPALIEGHSAQLRNRFAGRRSTTYFTSYGCPFSCSFCSEPMTSNRRWFAKSPERVVDEIAMLKNDYGVDLVVFEDPIYFVDVRRVRRISELLLERKIDIWWTATSRLETIPKIDEATWDIFKRSGLEQVFIGIESASPTILKAVGKKYTADDIVNVARILHDKDVLLVCSFIQGIPVETKDRSLAEIAEEDLRLASQTILRMYDVAPRTTVAVFMYTPYPGSVAYDLSVKLGYEPPETLDGYRSYSHFSNQVPWMLPEQETFTEASLLAQSALKGKMGTRSKRRRPIRKMIISAYTMATRARYGSGNFKYAADQKVMAALVQRMSRRKGRRDKEGMLI